MKSKLHHLLGILSLRSWVAFLALGLLMLAVIMPNTLNASRHAIDNDIEAENSPVEPGRAAWEAGDSDTPPAPQAGDHRHGARGKPPEPHLLIDHSPAHRCNEIFGL